MTGGTAALQNDSITIGQIAIVGTRGWLCPGNPGFSDEDERIYMRELQRLKLSLDSAGENSFKIAMMHFPPFNDKQHSSGFTDLMESYGVDHVVYAHLHGKACKIAFEGKLRGVDYTLCSSDHLIFSPKLIL